MAIESYARLDTTEFEALCDQYLSLRKRKTFDLKVQNGLKTLIELHADLTTLSAFLLFHLPEKDRQKISVDDFTAHLLRRIDGLRGIAAIGSVQQGQSLEAVRKMFLAMSKDLRVVLVLMALRYADLFELDQFSPALRRQVARETLDIFVSIIGRLGIYTLKRKLEDLCFLYLSEEDYRSMEESFLAREELQEKTIRRLVKQTEEFLHSQGLDAHVSGRVKGKYSTYMKFKRKGGGALDDVYDLLALRVVVPKSSDCYTVLSLVNNRWQPITGRFKDYIAMPKVNGYRSLHITVLGMIEASPQPVEIQIRTEEMHREAEFGIAAHWWYEEQGIKQKTNLEPFLGNNLYEERLQWVKNLVHLQEYLTDQKKDQSLDFFSDRIFVMTLTGQVIELPRGSTPLDFAYEISEALGNHCSKAKVNGKVVPLDYQLQNGDRVYVVRNLEVSPNLYWLSLAHTEKARSAIRQSLLEQGEDTVLDQGVRMVNRQLRRFGHSALDNKYLLLSQYQQKDLNLEKRREFLIAIGKGELSAAEVVRDLLSSSERTKKGEDAPAPLKEVQHGSISVGGETGFKTKLSACCNPDLGTPIQGYVTRGGFISIHSRSCKVLSSLDPHRFIDVWWDGHQELSQDIRVEVVVSLANLLTSLSERLKERHIALNSFYHTRHEYGYALLFDLTVDRGQNITELLDSWKALDGVVSVRMLQVGEEVY